MLKQRVVTALALLAVLLPSLFSESPSPFRAFSLLLISAGAWEWARLNGGGSWGSLLVGGVFSLVSVLSWQVDLLILPFQPLWLAAALLWLFGGGLVLRLGATSWRRRPYALRLAVGLFALFTAWVAVVQALSLGVNFLLSALALVWMADIGAYFAGRALGGRIFKRKLAPTVSPGKSWEGVVGGVIGVVFLAWGWITLEAVFSPGNPSLYLRLAGFGTGLFIFSLVLLCGMSVLGDLFESLVKRAAGVKDSSGLLPGHGGVLDRVDALLPALPVAMLLSSFSQRL